MPTPTGRKERRKAHMLEIRSPRKVRVIPTTPELRGILRHPVLGLKFPATGSAEWPRDAFTKRRVQDGSVRLDWAMPNVYLAGYAIKGSSNAYIDLGNISIPAGDWCIFFTAAVPATVNTDFYLFNMGSISDTILTDNGNLNIGWPGSGSNGLYNWGWAATGKDDAGNWISTRQLTLFGASIRCLTGPQQYASGNPDAVARTLFLQKSGDVISLWIVDPNTTARQFDDYGTSFGAIASKPARLGCVGKAALAGFSAITYQRFGKIAQALTPRQMEAIASGVDPRAVATLSAAAGDLLWAFDAAATDLRVYSDLIQARAATAHGTFASATPLLPQVIAHDQVRLDVGRYQVFQSSGATTDIHISGRVYEEDSEVQVQLVNEVNGTEQVAYTSVGESNNGVFSGVLTGVPTRLSGYRAKAKKVSSGSEFLASSSQFQTGIVVEWLGQSLPVQMRTIGNYSPTGTVANNTCYQSTHFDPNGAAAVAEGWSRRVAAGYGEAHFAEIIGNGLGYTVGQLNDALSGSPIIAWLADTNGVLTNAINNIQRFRPKYIIWHQGENSLGDTYAGHQTNLDTLYGLLKAAITWDWKFLVVPLDNTFTAGAVAMNYHKIREAQSAWIDAKRAAGDTRVVFAATVADILKADTNADGIHKLGVPGGYGKYAERLAQTILYLEGAASYSGLGPRITAAVWNAATVIDVTVAHNGGTALQTPNVADVTGFEVSINNFSATLAIASAVILNATTIRVTLTGTPGSAPAIRYLWGLPGAGTTDIANGLSNPVYDNRVPAINTTLGFPLVYTLTPFQC